MRGARVFGRTEHYFFVEGRHRKALRLQAGFFALFAALLPVSMIRTIAADAAERLLNRSPAKIGWHFMKSDVKIVPGEVVLCSVNQVFCDIEALFRFFNAMQSIPLGVKHTNQEGKRTSV